MLRNHTIKKKKLLEQSENSQDVSSEDSKSSIAQRDKEYVDAVVIGDKENVDAMALGRG